MSLLKKIESLPEGKRMIASARLRRQILKALDDSLENSKMSQADLARKLNLSRSAVSQVFNGDGNLKIETVSDYLFETGSRLELVVIPNSMQFSSTFFKGAKNLNDRDVMTYRYVNSKSTNSGLLQNSHFKSVVPDSENTNVMIG